MIQALNCQVFDRLGAVVKLAQEVQDERELTGKRALFKTGLKK